MNAQTEKYKDFVQVFTATLSTHLSIKIGIFEYFDKQKTKDFYEKFPLYYFFEEAIRTECVLSIAKMVEYGNDSYTINKFLNYIDSNFTQISAQYPKLTQDIIRKNKQSLATISTQISTINTIRNKYYAHADKLYFTKSEDIKASFPDLLEEIIEVLNTLIGIVSDHHNILYGSCPINNYHLGLLGAEQLFNKLNTSSN